jgi:hypothetical protein
MDEIDIDLTFSRKISQRRRRREPFLRQRARAKSVKSRTTAS